MNAILGAKEAFNSVSLLDSTLINAIDFLPGAKEAGDVRVPTGSILVLGCGCLCKGTVNGEVVPRSLVAGSTKTLLQILSDGA